MKKARKILCLVVACLMALSLLAACGKTTVSEEKQASTQKADDKSSTQKEADTAKPSGPVKLKFTFPKPVDNPAMKEYIKYAKEKLNYDIEFVDINPVAQEYDKKLSISMMAGDAPADVFYYYAAILDKYIAADTVLPLNDIAQKANVNLQTKYGTGLTVKDNKVYGLPQTRDIWVTLYNKKIFDDAGVPYPTAEGWTWSKYIETAKKLTNPSKGIYGSFMNLDWDSFQYMTAHQKGIPDYKADGTSNFDDPAFIEALKFAHDLAGKEKIQPSILTLKSKQLPWDSFGTGKYAMTVNGGWSTCFVMDKKTYPRDWKYGVLPMPYPDGSKPASSMVIGGLAVAKGTKNAEAAFKLAELFASDSFKFDTERMPTRLDMSKDEINSYITTNFIKGHEDDGVTVEDYIKCWFNPEITLTPEKVNGPGASVINSTFISEGELYGIGKKSAEDAMKNVKQKADTAIAEEKKANK
ncbi:MAG: extracellular solute-binding protein [Clostridia bacterium]|nr:extracellular solute-binding protein [Clostridia bacterium]